MSAWWARQSSNVYYVIAAIFALAYAAYFCLAMSYEFGSESSVRLFWMTLFAVFLILVSIVKDECGDSISNSCIRPLSAFVERKYQPLKV